MAEPTATGKTVLVIIETQAGPQPQLWHEDHGGFVGCAHLKRVDRFELPPTATPWSIDTAIFYLGSKCNAA